MGLWVFVEILNTHKSVQWMGSANLLQIAEVTENGDPNVLFQYDFKNDTFRQIREWTRLMQTLALFTGLTPQELKSDLADKRDILMQLVKNNVTDIQDLGMFFARYYSGRLVLKV